MPDNSLFYKIIGGLLGISGTLCTVICCMLLAKVNRMQDDITALIPNVAQNTASIAYLSKDIWDVKADVSKATDFRTQFLQLFAKREEEIE